LSRARIGHFLAILGAPLYFVAYYGLRVLFQSTHDLLSKLLFYLGVSAFFFGSIWISSRFFAAVVFQHSLGQASHAYFVEMYEANYQILVWFLRIIILLLSLTYVTLILKNDIGLPKWLAILNPIILLIIVISSLVWFPKLGYHIAPIAMNVTHFIFFSLIMFQLQKVQETSIN
jgi:hypothetical protein